MELKDKKNNEYHRVIKIINNCNNTEYRNGIIDGLKLANVLFRNELLETIFKREHKKDVQ